MLLPTLNSKTKLYPVPPYRNPRQAVRTAADYILNAGDSWFAHTPRAGSVRFRLQNVSDETERCVACHPSQFPARAAMVAFQNGYDIEQRVQLRFLIERFYNAAVPFYGHPGAYWTRFDLAPNNNLSRTADIVRMYEETISHRPTSMLERAAGYIRLSWRDRTELPKEEFDGNLAISSYKIAVDAWHVFDALYRRAHRDADRKMRDQIRDLILTTAPKDCQELCDQTIALVMMDRAGFADAISKNVALLRRYQHDDGGWVRGFNEPMSVTSLQFMTGEGAYALTLAGVPHGDPAIQRSIQRLLSQQQSFGGWLDAKGEPFLTPFLETKWAIRALSELYHGPGKANGWNSTVPRVRPVGAEGMVDTLEDLDRSWEPPAPAVQAAIRRLTAHPEPMVRQAALVAVGRWERRTAAGEDARAVAARLGDPAKMVWRAAAWSLRQLGNQGSGVDAIEAALTSQDERVRRGAARIFAQFFGPMAEQKQLARRLARMAVEDDDFLVRVEAVKASWRWFYRTDDPALKAEIADAILGRLAAEASEAERINLTQALHNILDDNVRLFTENWQPRLMTDGQRAISQVGWDDVQSMLVDRLTRALERGNTRQREGILRQFGYNFLRPRIGNDLEMPTFTAPENARRFLRALQPFLQDNEARIRVWAVQAAAAGPAGETEAAVRSLVRALRDSDPQVREFAQQSLGRYMIARPVAAAVQPELLALLAGEDEDSRRGALSAILTHPTLQTQAMVAPILAAHERSAQPRVREECLRNMSWIYDAHADARALEFLRTASSDPALQTAVIEALRASATRNGPLHRRQEAIVMLQKLAAVESADVRVIALDVLRRSATLRADPRILPILRAAVQDPLPRVRLAAVRQLTAFLRDPANRPIAQSVIRLALADADEPTRTEAAGALGVPVPSVTAQAAARAAEAAKLDYDYFLDRVQPIFMKKGSDGAACYSCHSTHALLQISQPGEDGGLTPAQLRQNYQSALKVIDLQFPEQSLILRKPLSPTENPPPGGITHSGGPRWPRGADSEEYRTLLAWIKGARLSETERRAAR